MIALKSYPAETFEDYMADYGNGQLEIDYLHPPPLPFKLDSVEAKAFIAPSGQLLAPLPKNEKQRQRSLDQLRGRKLSKIGSLPTMFETSNENVMDFDDELIESFDSIALRAKSTFNTKYSSISLMDRTNQVFISEEGSEIGSLPRDSTACSHAILAVSHHPNFRALTKKRFVVVQY